MLTVSTWVNNHEVERIELVRIKPTAGRPGEGEECTYSLRFYNGSLHHTLDGQITHPYIPNNPRPLTQAAMQYVSERLDRKPVVR